MNGKALVLVASIASGFVLMVPLGGLFDAMNWGVFHSWGLAHGSFLIAWPMLALLSYGLICLGRRILAA